MNSNAFVALRKYRDADFLRIKLQHLMLSEVIPSNDVIIIYGANYYGKIIYQELKMHNHVCCFIDAKKRDDMYDGVPIYEPNSDELKKRIDNNVQYRVIVIPTWDLDEVENVLDKLITTYKLTPVDCLISAVQHKKLLEIRNYRYEDNSREDPLLDWKNKDSDVVAIYASNSIYTTFLYMLLGEQWKKTYIIGTHLGENSTKRMIKYNIYNDCFYEGDNENKHEINAIINHRGMLFGEYAKKHNIPFFGTDHVDFAHYYFGTKFTYLEDGIFDYKEESHQTFTGNMLDGEHYHMFGHNKYVSKIILTGRAPILESIRQKVRVVSITELWDKKSKVEKEEMLSIFCFPIDKIQRLLSVNKNIFIFTQPFSDIGVVSEKEQIKIYDDILTHYDKKQVVIKPHPADKINYNKYFPECEVLKEVFPAELLQLVGMKIKKVVGISSTTLQGVFPQEKVDSYPELNPNAF